MRKSLAEDTGKLYSTTMVFPLNAKSSKHRQNFADSRIFKTKFYGYRLPMCFFVSLLSFYSDLHHLSRIIYSSLIFIPFSNKEPIYTKTAKFQIKIANIFWLFLSIGLSQINCFTKSQAVFLW